MARKARYHRRKKNPGHSHRRARVRTYRRRSRNPMVFVRRRRARRNPSVPGGAMTFLKNGLFGLLGLVATKQLPQVILGAKNTGVIGYVANAVAAGVGGALITKFAGKAAGVAATFGGALYVAERIITEQFSSVGAALSLSGLGDARALGDIRTGYFPLPVPTTGGAAMNPVLPPSLAAPAPAAGGRALSGLGAGRFGSRFAA